MTRRTAGSSASRPTSWLACIWVSTIPRPWGTARPAAMSPHPWSAISSRSPLPTSRQFRSALRLDQDGERESEDRPARCPRRPQGDHGGFQTHPGAFGRGAPIIRVARGTCSGGVRPGWPDAAYPWRRSGRGRRSAATGVHGVPKAPGRLAVRGQSGGTNNTTVARTWACACAWNVGNDIGRVLS